MALASLFECKPLRDGPGVFDRATRTRWYTAVLAGGPAVADNSGNPITIPGTQIDGATRRVLEAPDGAIAVLLRFGRDSGVTIGDDPAVTVFGLDGPAQTASPTRLYSDGAVADVPLVTDTTDVREGDLLFTEVSPSAHRFDLLGCPFLIVSVLVPATAAVGSLATSVIQAKFIDY